MMKTRCSKYIRCDLPSGGQQHLLKCLSLLYNTLLMMLVCALFISIHSGKDNTITMQYNFMIGELLLLLLLKEYSRSHVTCKELCPFQTKTHDNSIVVRVTRLNTK